MAKSFPQLLPDAVWRRGFRRRMLRWFARNAQDLPWRRTRDPYAVWISEIMLQQTQVAAVVGYFERFIHIFPTVRQLAHAEEEQVLRLWEGLGYYRRARQLHRAAKILVQQYAGIFPQDLDALHRLPGVGRYTAGAILSIAFDRPAPILEANTVRVFCRLLAYGGNPHAATGQELLWSMARAVLPRKHSGQLNQALMELGREICQPRRPRCEHCPVFPLCRAAQRGLQEKIPPSRRKPVLETAREAAVIIRRRGRVLVLKRPDIPRWSGLWDFPRFAFPEVPPDRIADALAREVHRIAGVRIAIGPRLTTFRYGVTRFRITLDCYAAKYLSSASSPPPPTRQQWLRPAELEGIPLNRTARKLAEML
jgi:A/G-specific adenine glycosylase